MLEDQFDIFSVPPSKKDKVEFAPIRTTEIKALVARKKDQNWEGMQDIRGLIETRDILEFAAVRNIAGAVQEASNKLANLQSSKEGYSRTRAEQIFDQIIASPDRNLSQRQQDALEKGRDTVLHSIDEFNTWLDEHSEDSIYPLLGNRFEKIDRSKLKIDTKRFPGAVVIEVTDPETYQSIRGKETSSGFYNKDVGEQMLKGRILVINAQGANDEARHEYQHFLFSQTSKDIEFLPEVSERKIEQEEEKSEMAYKRKKAKLEGERLEAEIAADEDFDQYGRVTAETTERIILAEKALRGLPTLQEIALTARETKYRTYPKGPLRDAFTRFKNEIMAYASAGGKRAKVETYFGDSLKEALNDPYFELFKTEVYLVKNTMEQASTKGIPMERIGFLVGGARNMQQAAKFVFLETQLSEIETDLAKSSLIVPSQEHA